MKNKIIEYKEKGVVVLKKYLDEKIIDEIRDEAKKIFSYAIKKNGISFDLENEESFTKALFQLFKISYSDFIGAAKAVQHIISMHQLSVSQDILGLLKDFGLKHPTLCVKPLIYFNSPNLAKIEGHYKTPAHQDWRSMQGSLNSVVIWIPLIDIDVPLGAVEFVPGSHFKGLVDSEKDEWFRRIDTDELESEFIPAEVDKGDVVIFSAFTIHRSGNNITDMIRWSMHFRYNDVLEETYIDRGLPHPYIVYRPEQEIISPDFPSSEQLKRTFS